MAIKEDVPSDSNQGFLGSLNSDAAKTKSNTIEIPRISLPKGGGALKGIDEKFQVNAANGTASFSVPLPVSPARNGFSPQLSLSYSSGSGNSLFGIGWNLGLPAIERGTDKKLPRYLDSDEPGNIDDEDHLLFSGMEELVPFLNQDQNRTTDQFKSGNLTIRRYRPRVEGGFSRIERIHHPEKGYYWKVTSKENTTTWFGYNTSCRIADPENPDRIYSWLPEFSYDNKGNWISYGYKEENLDSVINDIQEKNRFDKLALFSSKHLKSIRYGNQEAYYPDPEQPYELALPENKPYHFELVFDYGEHDHLKPEPADNNNWTTRKDPYSTYRPGFEIRTYRLCKRVLMFHKFPDLNSGNITLVSSMDFDHQPSDLQTAMNDRPSELTYLTAISQKGYIQKPDGSYSQKALPDLTFDYQWLTWNTDIHNVRTEDLAQAPSGMAGNYQWTDLYNEGINGLLSEQANAWFYKSNLGPDESGELRFSTARSVLPKPALTGLKEGLLQLHDIESNGGKQLVVISEDLQGYFDLSDEGEWQPFNAFLQKLNLNLADPNVKMLDLNGDGKPEVLLSDQGAFWWWGSKGKIGYDSPELATKAHDEEKGPTLIFADEENKIFLADMSGDGLTDLVRIRNGEICYWPNRGYGDFGAKVTMSNSPVFDHPELFNPIYIQLSDVSGTGASDILYLGKNQFKAYLNFSGNAWSDATEIAPFFPTEQPNKITVTDLLGNGTACIVWSSEMQAYKNAPMRYIDLMGGKKPHIMCSYENGFGKKTQLEYKSSTWYYLQDKLQGKPWITKLAFPVQCVCKTIATESVTNVRFSTQYSYHHGYFDHAEREFRGFGRVEQIDTEYFESFEKTGAGNVTSQEHHQLPMLTKTWYHTGAYLDEKRMLSQFREEYWYEEFKKKGFDTDAEEYELPEATISGSALNETDPQQLSAQEWREAFRACKGLVLRQEIFGLDATDPNDTEQQRTQATPFTVASHTSGIQLLQPRAKNRYAVFLVTETEAITYTYERNAADPRIIHSLNLQTDQYGNLLESVSVVYPRTGTEVLLNDAATDSPAGRNAKAMARKAQQKIWLTFTRNSLTNDINTPSNYQLCKIWQTRAYELTGIKPVSKIFSITEFKGLSDSWTEIAYQQKADESSPQKRLIEHTRTKFYDDDLKLPLAEGILSAKGIIYENYQLAYTPNLLEDIFTPSPASIAFEVAEADMRSGKFMLDNANWWIRSGTTQYYRTGDTMADVKARFFTPVAYTDPFNTTTEVFYDSMNFYMERAKDTFGNETRIVTYNFRTLSPVRMADINDNISSVIMDELGVFKASAVEGKDNNGDKTGEEGDDLADFKEITDATETDKTAQFFAAAQVNDICNYASLQSIARDLLKNASCMMLYKRDQQPTVTACITREQHARFNPDSPLQIALEYSDGFGKVAMRKVQATPGIATKAVQQGDGSWHVTSIDTGTQLRWVGNGRTVFNNKGNPIRQYEPYFSVSPVYEDALELVEAGVSPVFYYDVASRLIKTELPNGTFTKAVFDAWKQFNYDVNDTVTDSLWYSSRMALADGNAEKKAAKKSALHAGTPDCIILDTMGRAVLGIDHNRTEDATGNIKEEFYYTWAELNIEGNLVAVTDSRGNTVFSYRYDMLGNRVFKNGMDTGKRWMLNNVLGNPVKSWDERRQEFSFTYDALQRVISKWVKRAEQAVPLNLCYEKTVYGENLPEDKLKNLRGKTAVLYDTAGKVTSDSYDFKDNLLSSTRVYASDYKNTPDWNIANPDDLLEGTDYTFVTKTTYDAKNRSVKQTSADGSIIKPGFNTGGLMDRITVEKGASSTDYVQKVAYNAKGQLLSINYGNGVNADYDYDPLTFRLTGLRSIKSDNEVMQDLKYTYDPKGNITQMEDRAVPAVFFNNQKVIAKNEYSYDALYRLTAASGRESDTPYVFNPSDNWNDSIYKKQHAPDDPMAMRNYLQRYAYDTVGNILQMVHVAGDAGSWTRDYNYENKNNRLRNTVIGSNTFQYKYHPQHGFMTELPHLQQMNWNFKEELQLTAAQRRSDGGTAETTYYVYNAAGQRVRKITENQADPDSMPAIKEERLYIGSYELYSNENGIERETLSIMHDRQRIAIIDTETAPKTLLGIPVGRTSPALTIRYQLTVPSGSVGLELDEVAKVISYEEYHPFGTTAYQANNSSIKAAAKRYRYTGMERDEETGLEYHNARYYLPWLGRWLSADPIGIKAGTNAYAYVKNNPIIKYDSTGHWDVQWGQVAIGFGVAALAVGIVVVTAGIAGPAVIGGAAAILGVSEATVVTGVAVVGTAAGMVGTAETATQVITGRDTSGHTISDTERSRALGRLPVEAIATIIGARGITGGGGPPASAAAELLPAADGTATLMPSFNAPAISMPVATPQAAVAGTSVVSAMVMSSMLGGGPGGGSSGSGGSSGPTSPTEPAPAEPVNPEPVCSEPVTSEPISTEPISSEPISSEAPAVADPVSSPTSSSGTPPRPVGPYRSVAGHHVHQSASYSEGGPSASGNPNHGNAVCIEIEGSAADISSEHGRATAVQRLLNRSVNGRFSGSETVGEVTITVEGEGTLQSSASQGFEDVKAFYSMRAADVPGYQTADDVLGLVCRSGDQLPSPPVRVPSR